MNRTKKKVFKKLTNKFIFLLKEKTTISEYGNKQHKQKGSTG